MASIRQVDNYPFGGIHQSAPFFHTDIGFYPIEVGDTMVAFIQSIDDQSHVLSMTDSLGSVYSQVPGARVTIPAPTGSPLMVDVWVAQIKTRNTGDFSFEVLLDQNNTNDFGVGSGIVLFDLEGLGDYSIVLGNTPPSESAVSSINGPSLNGGSGAIFLAALGSLGCGIFAEPPADAGVTVNSPWDFFFSPNQPPLYGSGASLVIGPGNLAVASMIGDGTPPQAEFQLLINNPPYSTGDPTGSQFAVISGIAFIPSASGDTDGPFLGSVVVDNSAPAKPFLGTVKIVSAGPGGNNGPFLGRVRVRNTGVGTQPGNASKPFLGSVVQINEAPSGSSALGEVDTA